MFKFTKHPTNLRAWFYKFGIKQLFIKDLGMFCSALATEVVWLVKRTSWPT